MVQITHMPRIVSLPDLAATYRALVNSGAPIAEINAIRKHLSQESRERLLLDATIADACADEAERISNELNRTSMAGSVACGTRSWRTA